MSRNTSSLLLATVGPEMQIFAADVEAATLERIGKVTLPSDVQYCWPSPDHRRLYVASSNGHARAAGDNHYLTVLAIDPATRLLRPLGAPAALRSRPVHMCLDPAGKYAFVGYHYPSGISVHRIGADGTIAEEIAQSSQLDTGIYPHHVRVAPSGRQVLLLARGNNPTASTPEEPGSLKLFDFSDGQLTNNSSVAPHEGYGFGPRDADFHRSLPYVYISLERQTKLNVFRYENGMLSSRPVFECETLKNPGHVVKRQNAGAIHLHPRGHAVYVANRGGPENPNDPDIGAENSIAVFRLDAKTGEPTLIQHADSDGVRPRTFDTDPSGRMFWAANLQQRVYEERDERRVLPAGIATFHVRPDGTLEYVTRYDITSGNSTLFWSGMLTFESW